MEQFLKLLSNSFVIWSRNFTLVYVFLMALFLFSLLLSQAGMPALELRWLLLAAVMVLIFAAIMAGWFNMVAKACTRFLDRPREEALKDISPLEPLRLFKEFLPGIGRFFPAITMGYLIQVGVAILLMLPAQPLLAKNMPLLEKLALQGPAGRVRMIEGMTAAQQIALGEMSMIFLLGILLYGLFSLLIMLWPAFVVYYEENPFKAVFRSMRQFIRDPLRMIAISLLFILLRVPLFLVTSQLAPADPNQFSLIYAGVQLLNLLMEIFTAIVIFVYVYQAVGKPIEKENANSSEDTLDPV